MTIEPADMSERERMREFWFQHWQRDECMNMARHIKRERRFLSDLNTDRIISTNVQQAREANRQAVRLWYGRSTRS